MLSSLHLPPELTPNQLMMNTSSIWRVPGGHVIQSVSVLIGCCFYVMKSSVLSDHANLRYFMTTKELTSGREARLIRLHSRISTSEPVDDHVEFETGVLNRELRRSRHTKNRKDDGYQVIKTVGYATV